MSLPFYLSTCEEQVDMDQVEPTGVGWDTQAFGAGFSAGYDRGQAAVKREGVAMALTPALARLRAAVYPSPDTRIDLLVGDPDVYKQQVIRAAKYFIDALDGWCTSATL